MKCNKYNKWAIASLIIASLIWFLIIYKIATYDWMWANIEHDENLHFGSKTYIGPFNVLFFFTQFSNLVLSGFLFGFALSVTTKNAKVFKFFTSGPVVCVAVSMVGLTFTAVAIGEPLMAIMGHPEYTFFDSRWYHVIPIINNIGTITFHYIAPIFALVLFSKLPKLYKIKYKAILWTVAICLIYCIITILRGKFMLPIEWYPYPVTTPSFFGQYLLGEGYSITLAWGLYSLMVLLLTCVIVFYSYTLIKWHNIKVDARARRLAEKTCSPEIEQVKEEKIE